MSITRGSKVTKGKAVINLVRDMLFLDLGVANSMSNSRRTTIQ